MECQIGVRRRAAEWDEIEEAPQIKKYCEDVKAQTNQQQPPPATTQQSQMPQCQQQLPTTQPIAQPTPKFYISAPIQGYSTDSQGGCRYVFF